MTTPRTAAGRAHVSRYVNPYTPCADGREPHRWNPGHRPSKQRCDYCHVNRQAYSRRYQHRGLQRKLADVVAYGLAVPVR